jgi:hypothetical protein
MPGFQIVARLRQHYGKSALSSAQVHFWTKEAKRERTDFNPIASPGREPDEGLAAVIADDLDADPHLSARKFAQSLGIAVSTGCRYLTEALEMECWNLRWVPHTLRFAQK